MRKPKPAFDLDSPEIERLALKLEEAARAANVEQPRFVEPAQGTLARAKSRRHHIVFGRRGSGKTSLLAKAAADLTVDRRPIAFVNLETFKGHSYPDVLLSVLIESLSRFKDWLETAATNPASKTSFWKKLFGSVPTRPPFARAGVAQLVSMIGSQIDALTRELHSPEQSRITETHEEAKANESGVSAAARVRGGPIGGSVEVTSGEAVSCRSLRTEESRQRKVDFLHRSIIAFQHVFRKIAEVSAGDSFLFLDDLYYIRKSDQPMVIDYFHRIAKGSRMWLKVGTIRHRTEWYRHSDPPVGLKLGDDAEEIDLDVTLEKYAMAKRFLMNILRTVAEEADYSGVGELLTPTAIDRLVLASGGVARDFLALFRRAIQVARAREGGARGPRITAEDVNQAAGEYESLKRDELKRDTLEEREQIERAFEAVKGFCIDKSRSNCFLIQKDRIDEAARLVEELVDLRLLHLVEPRVTISGRPGRLYVAYMLDLGQYAGERKRRNLEMIPFWQRGARDRLRRAGLIFDPQALGDTQK